MKTINDQCFKARANVSNIIVGSYTISKFRSVSKSKVVMYFRDSLFNCEEIYHPEHGR